MSSCLRKLCCCFIRVPIPDPEPQRPRLKQYPPLDRRIILIKEEADRIRREIEEDEKLNGHLRNQSRII